jgi:hypothetical protein
MLKQSTNILGHREPFDAVPFFWSQHYDVASTWRVCRSAIHQPSDRISARRRDDGAGARIPW